MKKKLLLAAFVTLLIGMVPTRISAQQDGFLGEVKLFAGNFAPRNWTFCEGQLLPISQNTALFSILGTIYGGNGTTTFALPDLRGRVPVGAGNGPGLSVIREGQIQGAENVTLTTAQLPYHNHGLVNVAEAEIKTTSGDNTIKVLTPVTSAGSTTVTTQNTGGSQSINIKPPSLGMHYIICLYGTFPSRN